jgi:putative NIF3 family GTP cyclohydrolase 1 type 2
VEWGFGKNSKKESVTFADLDRFLHQYFRTDRYPPDERGGVWVPGTRPVRRIGLALDGDAVPPAWVSEHDLDALWLHRPWRLAAGTLPPGVGVLAHHLPFDETLTMGENAPLAEMLGLTNAEPLGTKQSEGYPARAIGMLGEVPPRVLPGWLHWAEAEFGGYDRLHAGAPGALTRLAVVGAMNETLLCEAARRGARLYLTGQYRGGAQAAVEETGLTVLALGHARTEAWGLRALGRVLAGCGITPLILTQDRQKN